MSARNATVAIESAANSASAESFGKKQEKSPQIKKTFSLKIVGSDKMFLHRP